MDNFWKAMILVLSLFNVWGASFDGRHSEQLKRHEKAIDKLVGEVYTQSRYDSYRDNINARYWHPKINGDTPENYSKVVSEEGNNWFNKDAIEKDKKLFYEILKD